MSLEASHSVSATEAAQRHVLRKDWVACGEAFLDCRIPGSDRKVNYALVGMGVAQNAEQVINPPLWWCQSLTYFSNTVGVKTFSPYTFIGSWGAELYAAK